MKTKDKVHNLIILDESGSMNSIKPQIISGFNEVVQTVKGVAEKYPEQAHFITFISFNSMGITTHLDGAPASKLKEITGDKYKPNAGTPLFDAMGYGIHKLQQAKANEGSNVLVTILTDGLENASKEFNKQAIKALVEEMEDKKWTFTYIGTDHDVEAFASSIAIKNTLIFGKNEEGLKEMFEEEKAARFRYGGKIRAKENAKLNFYMGNEPM